MEDQLFGCNLAADRQHRHRPGHELPQPASATQRQADRSPSRSIIANRQATFTLGQDSTSVLELTGAFAALANDGVFCPPTPIQSVTDRNGKPVPFKRPGCSRQFDSFIARTLVNIMTNDTHGGYGTAGSSATGTATAAAWSRPRPVPTTAARSSTVQTTDDGRATRRCGSSASRRT